MLYEEIHERVLVALAIKYYQGRSYYYAALLAVVGSPVSPEPK